MRRIRTLLELSLAGGAAIGILALSLPQFLGGENKIEPASTVPTASPEAIAAAPTPTPDIAHFLGIAQFIKSPTEYGFICGLACNESDTAAKGEVVSASLEGDRMEIEYRYPTANRLNTGKLIGKLNSDGVFNGIYQDNNQTTLSKGDITFTFAADGTAQGSYNEGQGPVQIIL